MRQNEAKIHFFGFHTNAGCGFYSLKNVLLGHNTIFIGESNFGTHINCQQAVKLVHLTISIFGQFSFFSSNLFLLGLFPYSKVLVIFVPQNTLDNYNLLLIT